MKITKPITSHSTNSVLGNCRIDPSRNDGFIRKRFLRKMMAALLMVASLALFLCAAGGVSYGDSARLTSPKVTVDAQFYPTFGTPNDALVTADDSYVLVSVSQVAHPPFGATGVQVFKKPDFTNPCGGQQIISFPQPIPGSTPPPPGGPVQTVDGMKFFPGSPQVSVGAAVEAQGAEFFRLASLNQPCAVDGIINVQQPPVIPDCAQQLCPPGTFDLAVTPDGRYAFVANEYGALPNPPPNNVNAGSGTIGIIRVQRDHSGRFTPGTRSIVPTPYIYIPGGSAIPGVTTSHDGKYVFVTSEGAVEGINPETMMPYRDPTNVQNSQNGTVLCPGCLDSVNRCDNKSDGTQASNGLLTVIDVNKARRGMGQASIKTIIACGCSPVRAVETADGQYVFVATRGRNNELPLPPEQGASGYQVLAFHRATLVSHSPNDALVGYGDTHGTAPVGMALFNGDNLLAVANGNRYFYESGCVNPPPGRPPCTASVAIMDVSNPAAPTVEQVIPNADNAFPRNITLGPDGSTLYVPNAGCAQPTMACQEVKMLEVITTSVH
jgi:hypothetical protein